ncbi:MULTISPECIES: chaperone modulator CbpM [unclassified Methylophaga]|uniref:MerR family transcriptional regulator n=1 Tax=Pseudidiomarina aestuarii TaxID=624146 RepID=A0A2T4CYM9_9GAMM|nr:MULTISPECIES: chaperone modulator CbpM [unclassified Methylophaga]PTB86670.1 MerR family transcriptional regulator [Pseudidiomarina aestuarii]MAL50536.1 MerR family transcriptional regulator [Methylophaga sp.]MAP25789.1 MerR family transcriptional regulator [Methylophaga sp.]MBP25148.1 MerR family transcriptional regulator [Methylophaga sp.]HAD31699.1 MerR family transcriptional regulator [Methylophaga sp.]
MQSDIDVYQSISHLLSFKQICNRCGLPQKKLTEMLDYGVITPSAMTILDHEALYETDCVRKVHIAMRLCRDLELNMAGAALAIELLDEINSLRERLQID